MPGPQTRSRTSSRCVTSASSAAQVKQPNTALPRHVPNPPCRHVQRLARHKAQKHQRARRPDEPSNLMEAVIQKKEEFMKTLHQNT